MKLLRHACSPFVAGVVAATLFVLPGCTGAQLRHGGASSASSSAEVGLDTATRLRWIAQARRTPPIKQVPITFVDDPAFALVLGRESEFLSRELQGKGDDSEVGASPSLGDAKPASEIEKQILAIYSTREHQVFVRAGALLGHTGFLLDHELEHAVQEQRFGLAPPMPADSLDSLLARSAIVEGDATLTAMLAGAARTGAHLGPAVSAASRFGAGVAAAKGAGIKSGDDPGRAERLRTFQWKYSRGTEFAAELLHVGGFALLDDALAHPPGSTEQVLHVEKFLAGELPTPVKVPDVPAGWQLVESGTSGELGTATWLSRCLAPDVAVRAAEGWAGDAYVIVRQGARVGRIAVSAWDDEAAASRFERAALDFAHCFKVEKGTTVLRHGGRVALRLGVAAEPHAVEALFDLVGPTPARAPRVLANGAAGADSRLPREQDFNGDVRPLGERFVMPAIGVEVPRLGLPATASREAALLATRPGFGATVSLVWSRPAPDWEELLFATSAQAAGITTIPKVVRGITRSAVGVADLLVATVRPGFKMKMMFTPVCGGDGTLVQLLAYATTNGAEELASLWFEGTHDIGIETSPSCAALRELPEPQ